ncbi:hypothetical protein ACE6H2_028291 [Prunus campanulata]
MAPSTTSVQGENGSEEKLSLLLLVPMPYIAVDDACYVSALLLLPVMVPVLLLMPLLVCLPCLPYFLGFGFCRIFCRAHRASVFCLIYCCAHKASVFCLICCRAHRVSVLCYVPYFLGFALVFPLRTLL